MAQNFSKAIKSFKPHHISDVATMMMQSIHGYYDPQDIKYAGIHATNTLRYILRNRGFNDYSGNLSRSYYVKFSKQGANYVFTARGVKPPVGDKTERGNYIYYLRTKRHEPRFKYKQWRTYKGIGRRHRKNVNTHFFRYFRPGKENGPGEILYGEGNERGIYNRTGSNQYLDRFSGPNKRSAPARGWRKYGWKDVYITSTYEIGNDTPYAPMVEARGYRVMSPIMANRLKKEIEAATFGEMRVAVRNMVYDFNRGYVGWFDKRKNPFAKK